MSRIILLDSAPLGLLSQPRLTPPIVACQTWLDGLIASGVEVRVPEITDYEVRRELLRAGKIRGLQRLNQLKNDLGYVAITTATMMQAALFWADVRQRGLPTAANDALDADVILAAQAALLAGVGHSVTIATTNVGHLARLAPAELWAKITS